ncbi:hypothetical protein AB0F17_16140 [Nonomuraea sp. NPDC026600]|uniref:hypothetical protein n=1 Tax=Nonomuraea sp. NPDC026600 TaxID=3155363 RepID=UPI00341167E1
MTITPISPSLVHIDDAADDYFADYAEGAQAGLAWLKTHPGRSEAQQIADLHTEIRAGGDGESSGNWHNCEIFPTFVPFMEREQHLTVINGPAYSAELAADPEVAYPYTIEWERAWFFHSDSGFWQGICHAIHHALNHL